MILPVLGEAQTFALHTILTKTIFVHSEDDVSPSILADIQNHNTCTVETLLNGLLSLCLPEDHKHNPPVGLLDECIEAVLPICNPQDNRKQTKRKNLADKETLADGSALLAHLTD